MRDVERRFATTMREADRHDPGLVMEDDGTVWIVAPGGDRAELGAGGGSVPPGDMPRALLNRHTVVPPDEYALLSWGINQQGSAVLDLSGDPTNPTFVEEGVYAVTAYFGIVEGSQLGKTCYYSLTMDPYGFDLSTFDNFALDQTPNSGLIGASVSACSYCPAGGIINLQVIHDAGVDLNFAFEAIIQRVA